MELDNWHFYNINVINIFYLLLIKNGNLPIQLAKAISLLNGQQNGYLQKKEANPLFYCYMGSPKKSQRFLL